MAESFDESSWTVLLARIGEQRVTPFIGAGISPHPKAAEIAESWARQYQYPEIFDPTDLARVAQYISIYEDGMWPKHLLLKRFATTLAPDFKDPFEPHRLLADLPCEMYVTTNYDRLMCDALRFRDRDPMRLTCRWNESIDKGATPKSPTVASPWVFHLHGADEEPQSMVLTEDDYVDFLVRCQRDPKYFRIRSCGPCRIPRCCSWVTVCLIGRSGSFSVASFARCRIRCSSGTWLCSCTAAKRRRHTCRSTLLA